MWLRQKGKGTNAGGDCRWQESSNYTASKLQSSPFGLGFLLGGKDVEGEF